ncbi:LPS export ABC transporter periplasmic protein LptC [Candidatus Liberibacter brunswickensis]|uniref:LPS export ABC transporter periplasmic protein LptC n=1 Tax=Candidatus Liberibacter brunswickensis TaxID=1968796 RepID=UPI002FE32D54
MDKRDKILLQGIKYRSHVRSIRLLKFFLPFMMILLAFWFCFSSWERIRTFSKPFIDLFDMEPMVMKKFILSNYSKDSIRYSLVAESAKAGFNSKNIFFLKNFELIVPTQSPDNLIIFAHSADLDLRRNILDINKPFKMKFKDSIQLDFKSAILDINKIYISSLHPVTVTHSDFVISAQSSQIDQSSKSAKFIGQVSVIMNPEILQGKNN